MKPGTEPLRDSNLTWTCHICHRERPNEKINTARHERVRPTGVRIQQNVRYCNDSQRCATSAILYDQTDLALQETVAEKKNLERRLSQRPFQGLVVAVAASASTLALTGFVAGWF